VLRFTYKLRRAVIARAFPPCAAAVSSTMAAARAWALAARGAAACRAAAAATTPKTTTSAAALAAAAAAAARVSPWAAALLPQRGCGGGAQRYTALLAAARGAERHSARAAPVPSASALRSSRGPWRPPLRSSSSPLLHAAAPPRGRALSTQRAPGAHAPRRDQQLRCLSLCMCTTALLLTTLVRTNCGPRRHCTHAASAAAADAAAASATSLGCASPLAFVARLREVRRELTVARWAERSAARLEREVRATTGARLWRAHAALAYKRVRLGELRRAAGGAAAQLSKQPAQAQAQPAQEGLQAGPLVAPANDELALLADDVAAARARLSACAATYATALRARRDAVAAARGAVLRAQNELDWLGSTYTSAHVHGARPRRAAALLLRAAARAPLPSFLWRAAAWSAGEAPLDFARAQHPLSRATFTFLDTHKFAIRQAVASLLLTLYFAFLWNMMHR
jgi:hypothetical protein